MYKVIDLGGEFQATGESRARLLDAPLVKTAGTAIQDYWASLKPNSDLAYLWVIGVSAMEYYGCNNNGDAFPEKDLIATIGDWQKNANIFLHHVNKDPAKGIGKPVFAWYNNDMHRVELILAINKHAAGAADVVRRIRDGEQMYVSMGCHVKYDVCSICGNKAKTRADYCDHLRYNMKRVLPDGRQVYAINPEPRFFDISIVTRPADPTAFALDKIASHGGFTGNVHVKSGAELGEEATDLFGKSAAVSKLADIIKQVEGRIADSKIDPEIKCVRDVYRAGFDDFDYPEIPYDALDAAGIGPHGLMAALCSLGCPPSIGDAYWMSGASHRGVSLKDVLDYMPLALDRLADEPSNIVPCVADLFNGRSCDDTADPVKRALVLRVVRPAVVQRITIIKQLRPSVKLAAEYDAFQESGREDANFAPIIVRDKDGNTSRVTRYHLDQARSLRGGFIKDALAGALAVSAISSIMLAPTAAKKAILGGAFGIPAAVLFGSDAFGDKVVVRNTGQEIPVRTISEAWKQPVATKTASAGAPRRFGGNFGAYAGMLTPAAIGLDYAYNRWKAEKYGTPEPDTRLHRLGRLIKENPASSVFVGGVIGALAHKGVKGIGRVLAGK